MQLTKIKNTLSVAAAVSVAAMGVVGVTRLFAEDANAGAVTNITLAGDGITATNSAEADTALGGTTDFSVSFDLATALVSDGQQISITLNGMDVTGSDLVVADLTLEDSGGAETIEAAPGTPDNGAHEVTITNGVDGNSDPVILITLDSSAGPVAPNFAAGTAVLTVTTDGNLESSTVNASYSISVTTSLDAGIALFYVGNDNDVVVTALVEPTLSFNIRTADDSADTNICDLGTLTSAGAPNIDGDGADAHECEYSLAIATNSASGFSATIHADQQMTGPGSATIAAVADVAAAFTAGTAEYGIVEVVAADSGFTSGTTYDTALTVGSDAGFDYSVDVAPIPIGAGSAATILSNTAAVDYAAGTASLPSGATQDVSIVVHGAAVPPAQAAGVYTQTVTYYVTASF